MSLYVPSFPSLRTHTAPWYECPFKFPLPAHTHTVPSVDVSGGGGRGLSIKLLWRIYGLIFQQNLCSQRKLSCLPTFYMISWGKNSWLMIRDCKSLYVPSNEKSAVNFAMSSSTQDRLGETRAGRLEQLSRQRNNVVRPTSLSGRTGM